MFYTFTPETKRLTSVFDVSIIISVISYFLSSLRWLKCGTAKKDTKLSRNPKFWERPWFLWLVNRGYSCAMLRVKHTNCCIRNATLVKCIRSCVEYQVEIAFDAVLAAMSRLAQMLYKKYTLGKMRVRKNTHTHTRILLPRIGINKGWVGISGGWRIFLSKI